MAPQPSFCCPCVGVVLFFFALLFAVVVGFSGNVKRGLALFGPLLWFLFCCFSLFLLCKSFIDIFLGVSLMVCGCLGVALRWVAFGGCCCCCCCGLRVAGCGLGKEPL